MSCHSTINSRTVGWAVRINALDLPMHVTERAWANGQVELPATLRPDE